MSAPIASEAPLREVVVTSLGRDADSQPPRGGARRTAVLLVTCVALIAAVALAVALSVAGETGELPAAARVLRSAPEGLFTATGANPFEGRAFYVNPSYKDSLAQSIATAEGDVKSTLEAMKDVPSAYWLSSKDKVKGVGPRTMEGILADAASKSPPELVTFIVYDLPNRDCHAKASNGEICCTYLANGQCDYTAAGTCEAGIKEYQSEYIDPIVELVREYQDKVPIVLVIEPDSLPNLSTNRADIRCGNSATVAAYRAGITYAVQTIGAAAPKVGIYLDAGHGGWLGWTNNMEDFVSNIKELGVAPYLRGFATNVAGYQSLGLMCPTFDYCLNNAHPEAECCSDPCALTKEWNPSHNEHQYSLHLRKAFSEGIPDFQPHMIIDTGRNGVPNMRTDCANWCNVRGAGVGLVSTTETANRDIVDAYFWLKTPGESDGCSEELPDGSLCPRFDHDCGSTDSLSSQSGEPKAPEAGEWFDYQVKQLAKNAHMGRAGAVAPRLPSRNNSAAPGANDSAAPGANRTAQLPPASEAKPGAGPTASGNPFAGKPFYVNPSYTVSLAASIATAEGDVKATLERMKSVPSAYWLDSKAKITGTDTRSMQGILADAAAKPVPELVTFIVYDLPNRDCHAKASNGEICCTYNADGLCNYEAAGTCEAGLAEYTKEYIDPIAAVLEAYDGKVPIVLVIEPDSLPNLSTNRADMRCGNSATVNAYRTGVKYAVEKIATSTKNVAIYLDAGHGGWLGWTNNMQDYVATIKDLGVSQYIRGFATNVAGYQGLGKMCPTFDYCLNHAHPEAECCYDPCGLTNEWNPSHNELNYAQHLHKAFSEGISGFEPHMIIDTGRNAVPNARGKCANWCNIRGAGVGLAPTTETAEPAIVDAYFWLKTPGESDGCTQTLPDGKQCARFDADCGSSDSLGSLSGEPRAPEAGAWFDYQVKQLAANARLA